MVGFLLGLEGAVLEASRVGAARCSLAAGNADLTFRLRDDGMLEVTSAANQAPAAAPIDDFFEALALLRRAARAWLEEAAPHLGKHRAWAEWFPTAETSGYVDREWRGVMARPGDIPEH